MSSRYGGLKLNDPVGPGGETIMDYSIYDARHAGFSKIVFVIRRAIEEPFKALVEARIGRRFPVEFVYQEVTGIPPGFHVPHGRIRPWGTTHAILTASGVIHEPFAVINVGDFYGTESYQALAHHLQTGSGDYGMVGYVLRNTLFDFGPAARGICQVGEHCMLEGIAELKHVEREGGHARSTDSSGKETRLTGDEIVSMNMWGFTPRIFAQLQQRFTRFLEENGADQQAECAIPNTMDELIRAGEARVRVVQCIDTWFGVTYQEDYSRAVESIRHLIEAGYYPRKLW